MDPIERVKAALSLVSIPPPRKHLIQGAKTEKEDVKCINQNDPFSFAAFVSRMSTYKPQHWSSAPKAAVCFAKQGFVCIADHVVQCCGCKEEINVSCSWGKREIKKIVLMSHKYSCKWKILSTPEEYFRFPVDHNYVIRKFREIFVDLLEMGTQLPVFLPQKLKPCVLIPQDSIDSVLTSLGVPVGDVQTSAIVLGLCGWVKLSKTTFQCNFCLRTCATWNFFAVEDDEWKIDFSVTSVEQNESNSMLKNEKNRNVENEFQKSHLMQNKSKEMIIQSNNCSRKQSRLSKNGDRKIKKGVKKMSKSKNDKFRSRMPRVSESNLLDYEIQCGSSRTYDNLYSGASGFSLCLNSNDESKISPGRISKHVSQTSHVITTNALQTSLNSRSPADIENIQHKNDCFDPVNTSVEILSPNFPLSCSKVIQSSNSPGTASCDAISPCIPKENEHSGNGTPYLNNQDLSTNERTETHSPAEKMDLECNDNVWNNIPELQNSKYAEDYPQESRESVPTISSVVGEYTMYWVNNNEKHASSQGQSSYFAIDSPLRLGRYEIKKENITNETNDFSDQSSVSNSSLYSEKMFPKLKTSVSPVDNKHYIYSPFWDAGKSKKRALLFLRNQRNDKFNMKMVKNFSFQNSIYEGGEDNPILISEDELSSEGNDDFVSHRNIEYKIGALYKRELEDLNHTSKQQSRELTPNLKTERMRRRKCSESINYSLQPLQCKYDDNNKIQANRVLVDMDGECHSSNINEYREESHNTQYLEDSNCWYDNTCYPKRVTDDCNDINQTGNIKQQEKKINSRSISSISQEVPVNVADSDRKDNNISFGRNKIDNTNPQVKVVNRFLSGFEGECSDKMNQNCCSENSTQNYIPISGENMISSYSEKVHLYSDKSMEKGEDNGEIPCVLSDIPAETSDGRERLICSDHPSKNVAQNVSIVDQQPNNNCTNRERKVEEDNPDVLCTVGVSSTNLKEIPDSSHNHLKDPHHSGEEETSSAISKDQEKEKTISIGGTGSGSSIEPRSNKRKLQETDISADDEVFLKFMKIENKKIFFHPELEHHFWCVWRMKNRCPDKTAISRKCWEIFLEMVKKKLELQEMDKKWTEFSDVLNCISSIWNL